MSNIIGTCALCGGAVTTPSTWFGVVPPTPTCSRCGAVSTASHGPTIPMRRRAPSTPAVDEARKIAERILSKPQA